MEFGIRENQNDLNIDNKREVVFPPEKIEEIKQTFESYYEEEVGPSKEVYDNLSNASEDYEKVIENLEIKINVKGKDKDIDQEKIRKFLDSRFDEEILRVSLIKSFEVDFDTIIVYLPNDNSIGLKKGNYFIPKNIFEETLKDEKEREYFSGYVFRAGSNANYFTEGDTGGKFLPTPISIYNQEYDKQNIGLNNKEIDDNGLSYLQNTKEEKRKELYKLGTISHEIGHHFYAYFIQGTESQEEWKKIIDECGDITNYANNQKKKEEKNYDENFAEAIRIYTTCSNCLDSRYKNVKEFLKEFFEDLVKEGN